MKHPNLPFLLALIVVLLIGGVFVHMFLSNNAESDVAPEVTEPEVTDEKLSQRRLDESMQDMQEFVPTEEAAIRLEDSSFEREEYQADQIVLDRLKESLEEDAQ